MQYATTERLETRGVVCDVYSACLSVYMYQLPFALFLSQDWLDTLKKFLATSLTCQNLII